VADATACPYMALGALIHAGVEGIERKLTLPEPVTKSIAAMHDAERQAANLRPLPASLPEALELLRTTPAAKKWFGPEFLDLYLNFKQDEADQLAGLAPQEICNRYAAVY
jgi:glutamine synthetase